MSGKLWSEAEYVTLRELYARQVPIVDMVQYLPGRSVNGIWQAAVRAKLVKAKEPSPLLPQQGECEIYSAASIARSSARFVADGLKLMAARS